MPNQEHERDQTHSYWYIPSAPRVDYSLLVMESAGMMKMATEEGFPLRQGAGTGLDWFSVATEAFGGGTPDLGYFPEDSVYIGGVGVGAKQRGSTGCPRGRGRAPHSRGQPVGLLVPLRQGAGTGSRLVFRGY